MSASSAATNATSGESKSILIVEDHPMVADAMQELLRRLEMGAGTVVCHSAEAAVETFHRSDPSIWFRILLDVDVPGAHGLSLVRQFWRFGVAQRCCVITGFDRPEWAAEVRAMGMLGYLLKAIPVEQFAASLEDVLRGECIFPVASSHQGGCSIRLTRRHRDILFLLHQGYISKEIAERLGVAEGTVKNHISGLLRALGVNNRTHAIAKAMELGYLQTKDISSQQSTER